MSTRQWLGLIVLAIALTILFTNCSRIHPRSEFLTRFSLKKTIEQMNLEEIDVSTVSVLSTEAAGDPTRLRRDYDLLIDLKADGFNEGAFLSKLKAKIMEEARNSGLSISGDGTGGDTFHVEYRNGNHAGGIDVLGVRPEKNKYRVWCVIRELAAPEQ